MTCTYVCACTYSAWTSRSPPRLHLPLALVYASSERRNATAISRPPVEVEKCCNLLVVSCLLGAWRDEGVRRTTRSSCCRRLLGISKTKSCVSRRDSAVDRQWSCKSSRDGQRPRRLVSDADVRMGPSTLQTGRFRREEQNIVSQKLAVNDTFDF